MNTPAELTQGAFARHIGVKPGYVTQLKKDGRLVMSADGRRVVVADSIARIESSRSPDKAHVAARHAAARGDAPPDAETEDVGTSSYQESRAKREKFAALMAELDYRKAAGELIEVEVVRATLADILAVLRNGLESLPDVLAPQLAPVADEAVIRARLSDEVEIAMRNVSERFAEEVK